MSNLCSVVLNKLVAVWIGPVGMGLYCLYNSAIEMVRSATSLGLRTSCVRDVSLAGQSGNAERLAQVVAVIRRWAWFAGIFGAVVMLAGAPALSRWSFGNDKHMWDFVFLSCTLMFNGLANSELAILQGGELLKRLARASLLGAVGGLVMSVPLFYFLRQDSILISVILYHVALFGAALVYRNKEIPKVEISNRQAIREGGSFVRLGILMTLSEFITLLFTYIFSAWLNRTAGTEMVGFYQSGNALVVRYIALLFTAVGMEYYPRLTRVCHSRRRTSAFVSMEITIVMLCLIPAVSLFLLMREWIVSLLYSREFHVIIPYISLAVVGNVLRAYSSFMAYAIVARGDGRIYILTESLSVVIGFCLNIWAFTNWGLEGIGIAFILWYAAYSIIIGIVYRFRYHCTLSRSTNLVSAATLVFTMAVLALINQGLTITVTALTLIATTIVCIVLRRMMRRHN